MANGNSTTPIAVTRPTTGYYLLTPRGWNGEERQALYNLSDKHELLCEMAIAMDTTPGELDQPLQVFVEALADGIFEIGTNWTRYQMDDEGFIREISK